MIFVFLLKDCLRNTRRRSFGWRQLYSYSDDHHCQFKMQRSLIWWHSWLRRRRKRVISPMYKALIFWKLRHGHRLFESWRAQLTDKLFRAQALKKLDEFHGRKQRLMVLFRLQELQQFRYVFNICSYLTSHSFLLFFSYLGKKREILNDKNSKKVYQFEGFSQNYAVFFDGNLTPILVDTVSSTYRRR